MIKKITLIYLFFGFFAGVGFNAYSQINFSTPSIGFTQACASSGFNTFNFSFSFFPASGLQPGNQFIVELSNSSGSFASPTVVKVLTNTTSPVSSNFNLPTNTYGPGYRIRVRSTAPVKVSNPSAAFPAYYAVHNQPFAINNNVGTVSICENDTYTLQIDNNGTPASPMYYPGLQYRWLKNFVVIPGETGPSITVSEPGSYYVEVDYGTCSMNSYSNIVQVQVMSNLSPSITSENNSTIICPGGTNTLTSSLTSSSYTYQWYKDNVQIAGATGTTYAASEGGVYHLAVANGPCIFESDFIALDETDFSLSINPATVTTLIPGETITITATDDANAPSYQWHKDNIAISGAVSSVYNATEAGTYKVAVTQLTPCATTKESEVTIVYPTSFDLAVQPAAAYTACVNNTVTLAISTFQANTLGGPVNLIGNTYPYNYQWYRNDVAISGATGDQLLINDPTQNGIYKLIVTAGSYGDITSNTFDVNLTPGAATIAGNTTLCEGSDVLLSSSITDPAYSYQWYKDSSPVAGAVNSTLSVTAEGDYYVITGTGSCTEQSNTLSVALAQISVTTTTPLTDVILPGQTETLQVTTDAQVPSYSWTRNGVNLAETTGTLSATQDGEYTVAVTQTSGCAVTEEQTFILEYPTGFTITIAPAAGYTACTSVSATLQTASFTATTTQGIMDVSAMPYAYQWYRDDVAISGETTPTLNINNALQNGTYKLGITIPDFGLVFSNNLTIDLALPAVAINSNTVLCEGSDVLLTSTVNDGGYTYQWYKDNVAISGAVAPLYSANEEGNYHLVVTSGACTAQSNTITLTIAAITISTTSPVTDVIIPGQTKTLSITTDAQVPTFTWTRNGVALANTTATLNATEDGEYIVTVTQTSGCNASEQQTFTLEYPSGFDLAVSTAAGYTACTSTSATLQTSSFTATTTQGIVDVTAMGYVLQWYKNDVPVSGAASATLALNDASANGIYKLGAEVPAFGTIFSNSITINLALPPVTITNDTELCAGGDVIISASENNALYAYQWYKDSILLAGATSSTLTANAEGAYYVTVNSGTCSATSNTVTLAVATITANSTSPDNAVILPGQTININVTTDAVAPAYSWTRNGVATGDTTPTLNATEDGEYIVTITQTSGCPATVQKTFTLEYPSAFDLTVTSAPDYTACTSTSATLQVSAFTATTTQGIVDVTTMGYAYQWYKNDVPVAGATAATLTINDASQNGDYKLGATVPGFGIIFSGNIVINLALPTVTISNDTGLCAGSDVTISASVSSPLYTYQWFKDGIAIAGATASAVTVNAEGAYYVDVTGGTCSTTSNTITLAIATIVVNSTFPDNAAILPGQTVNIPVTTDAQVPAYTWTRNGVAISNTTATLNATEDGEYTVTVTQTSGCAATAQKTFTLVYPTAFTMSIAETSGYTACVSASASLGQTAFTATTINGETDITAMGYPLQWYLNDAPVTGAIAPALTITNASQNGIYKLGATVPGFGIIYSNEISINLPLPGIVINSNTSLCEGSDVILSANITNTNYLYQWFKDGVAITGATALVYTANTEGAYSLEITVNGCTAASNTLNLAIAAINVNSTTPDTAILIPGQTETLAVTTDAQDPTYSWTHNDTPISGTTPTYNATEAGEYTVTVTQTTGCNATAEKTFVLEYPTGFNLTIAANSSYVACSSATASLNIAGFTATTPGGDVDVTSMGYSYQWYSNGNAVAGATAATLSLNSATQNGTYTLIATIPGFGTITSNGISIILGSGTLGIVASGSLCPTSPSITITPDITDAANTYTWFKDGIEIATGNTAILTATQQGSYYVVINTGTCTLTSNTIVVTESDFTLTTGNNLVDYIIPGESFVLSVSTDAVQPQFVWYRNDIVLTGETGSSLSATLDGTYKVVATQTQGCVMSRELTFVLAYPTGFDIQIGAGDYVPCSTTTAILSVVDFSAVTPNGPVDIIGDGYAYQWYFESSPLSGETANILDAATSGEYYLEVTIPDVGTIQSNSITLQLGFIDNVAITADGSLCADGGEVTLTSDIINPQYSYKWYSQDSGDVLGTGISLTVSTEGSYYLALAYQDCIITSNILEVESFDVSQVTIDTDPLTTITEGTVTLVTATGASAYQWFLNNEPFATGPSVTISEGGNYSVVATVGECTVTKTFVVSTTRNELLAIPNVVTPNNDGYNDKWSLPAKYLNNPDVEIIIYDAKGKMVFRQSSYNNSWPETDFEYPLNNPVYYYTITEDLEITKRGSITLIR